MLGVQTLIALWQMMRRLKNLIDELNVEIYNPAGLNILWPRKVAFLFVSTVGSKP